MKLSILIPVFNERYFIAELVRRVLDAPLPEGVSRELLVVDDGSTDGTCEVLEQLAEAHPQELRLVVHEKNRGKGAALRTAIAEASGDLCIFQDADLEYQPTDYPRVLEPLLAGDADVVYGSRFLPAGARRVLYYRHAVGNRFLTWLSNVFTNLNLSDMETGYKAFRTAVLKTIPLRSNDFRIEPEVTAKVAKRGLRVFEVPISYHGRTYLEGKKTGWTDGVLAVLTIFKYFLIDDLYDERTGHEILGNLSRAHRFNRWMADAIRPYLGDSILEIGAGIGNLTTHLLPRERYVATDFDDLYRDVLENLTLNRVHLEVARLDATNWEHFEPFAEEIDTVVCLNVLEHIADAPTALGNIWRVLAPGGRAVVLVPQGGWLYSTLDEALEHVKRYSRQDLAESLAASGFEVETIFDFNRIGVSGWLVNGKLFRRLTIPKAQLKIYDSLVWIWRWLDPVLPWHGLSLIAVARKPVARPPVFCRGHARIAPSPGRPAAGRPGPGASPQGADPR